ncbi:MAG: MBL fold metallo-hydrolase [Aigarchaeota archaeon]|nr:MBL fold metallo-hydrolase [Aigarchaeota archaeon]MDW8092358.1 MBL fold metallo-hydrolase [Nitrososphaerota archaeon]
MISYGGVNITWLGHDGFRIEGGGIEAVIDPFRLMMRGRRPAHVIFITHNHFDHCSPSDLQNVVDERASIVIAARNCEKELVGVAAREVRSVDPYQSGEAYGIRYRTVRAYNVNKFRSPGIPFHSKEYGGLGFIIEIEGVKIYHAGDTDKIPEMSSVGEVDVALLPVSGVYVMTADEAASAAEVIRPKLAIPMHFGSIVGSASDAERFKRLCRCRVEVLKVEE